mmetsp:Transcript_42778/g.101807  ORF Transcript_42778/g.101807 Transcript_42778/m.101807 type:complete len:252 (+) Transcript_42778:179-934(+)
MTHDAGVILVCAFCHSFFLSIIHTIEYKEYRGKEGTRRMEDEMAKLQAKMEQQRWASFRCPTCQECSTGLRYGDWLSSESPARLSPCMFHTFDPGEPPPIYVDASAGQGKPKFTLIQGIGPKTLEMDKSRSNRVYKPTLRGCIQVDRAWQSLQPFETTEHPDDYASRMEAVSQAAILSRDAQDEESQAFLEEVLSNAPLFLSPDRDRVLTQAQKILFDAQVTEFDRLRLGGPANDPFEGMVDRDDPFNDFM